MKKIILTLLVASSLVMTGQETEEKKFTLSGSVDTYFRGNISGGNFDTLRAALLLINQVLL